jgi:hypothetical protein
MPGPAPAGSKIVKGSPAGEWRPSRKTDLRKLVPAHPAGRAYARVGR